MEANTNVSPTAPPLSLVYIHIGKTLPDYIFDSIYQTLLINQYAVRVYVVVDDTLVSTVRDTIYNFNLPLYSKQAFYFGNVVEIVPLSALETRLQNDTSFSQYQNTLQQRYAGVGQFRDGFWVSTTSRFFYLQALMNVFQLHNCFHIENDIVMYESFVQIFTSVLSENDLSENDLSENDFGNILNKIWMVQDAPNRVVPSVIFFPTGSHASRLTHFIAETLSNANNFINDMDILVQYPDKLPLRIVPEDSRYCTIFDGAAIGQYLGGIDNRNVNETHPKTNTIGFINETSVFKPDTCHFTKRNVQTDNHTVPIKTILGSTKGSKQIFSVANAHVHSKELHRFSSVFDITHDKIVSGDRILGLCDFVIATRDIYNFHQHIEKYARDVIIVKDWKNVNIYALNEFFRKLSQKRKTNIVKLFIYTHILADFIENVLDKLDRTLEYVLYLHNSDHPFDFSYERLIVKPFIKHVYAQNIDYPIREPGANKLTLLPIGIANSMWKHGDLNAMFEVMTSTYKAKKTKNIYVNINPNTYGYRKDVLDVIRESGCWELSTNKPYIEYLRELAQHKFCLCLRGNGLDTHRFWESLYLGVIPVVFNNSETKCQNFLEYTKALGVPFVEIKENNLNIIPQRYHQDFFNETLYKQILQSSGCGIYNLPALQLDHYQYHD
uniref:Exostosin GT47 domain-containing protein n=1 Tax=viral metagenome TaxID=1070528 RepID=A0A6C0H793_9ZZZZ